MQFPESLRLRREEVLSKLATLKEQVQPIVEFLSNDEHVKLLKQDRTQNMNFLQSEFGIGPVQVDALYAFAKWNFECGNYAAGSEYLYHFRTLSTHPERNTNALWGKVATDILLQDYQCMDDVLKLKKLLENDTFAPVPRQLQQFFSLNATDWGAVVQAIKIDMGPERVLHAASDPRKDGSPAFFS